MFLIDWYKEFQQTRLEIKAQSIDLHKEEVCENCEYLKLQLEKQQQLNSELIDKLTNKPEAPAPPEQVRVGLKPKFVPFNVRRQTMEAEDRRAAAVLRQKQNEIANQLKVNVSPTGVSTETEVAPADDPDVIALEKAMDEAAKEREAQRG